MAVALATAVVLVFLLIGLVRWYPYGDDVTPGLDGDDWSSYKSFALSILEGGLRMPGVPKAYYLPGGFLYNYFVAAIFSVFGTSTGYVYVIQHACLGVASALMFFFARRSLAPDIAVVYLFACSLFYYQAFRDIVSRLLSENLVIVLYPLALLFLPTRTDHQAVWRSGLAGLFAGLVVLTRPNMMAFPILLGALVLTIDAPRARRMMHVTGFAVAAAAAFALLPLRNALVTGRFALSSQYGQLIPTAPISDFIVLFGKRVLYCLGVVIGGFNLRGTELIVNEVWLLMNVAAVGGVGLLIARRRFAMPEALCLATLAAAYIPFVLMPRLSGYGWRFQVPYGPVLLLLACRGADLVRHELQRRKAL